MRELPEVETTRRHLAPALEGHAIERVEVRRPRMIRRQHRLADVEQRLVARKLVRMQRHGKFIQAELDNDLTWVMHLGMSGRMQLATPGEAEAAHTNVVVLFDGPIELRFVDPRTFGFMAVFTPEELAASSLGDLGRDALDDLPRSSALADALRGRRAPIKSLLLDQRFLAGLGNIYADEVLHRSRIAPHRAAGSLTPSEVKALRAAIGPVLRAGLDAGGTSLDDLAYLLPDGRAGEYMSRLAVYGRTGEACRRCGGEVQSAVLRGRTTHWCDQCQV
jgi:formamidopyrimidine-DNA glycosylase